MPRAGKGTGARAQRGRFDESFALQRKALLLPAFCLLLFVFGLGASAIVSKQNANQSPSTKNSNAQASPTATSTPTPSPTPTPPLTLHQWGAVTLFHGLPSNRVRAIAEGPDGAMWFGTDGGLAKYDGRRTQAIAADGLAGKRVLSLKLSEDGALWVGTDSGAARLLGDEVRPVAETAGQVITAIITPERGRAILASEQGRIFDCRARSDGTLDIKTIPEKPLESADFERPGPLNLTSLALKDDVLYVGTRSRGVIGIKDGAVTEIQSRPRPFFVEAIEEDARGRLWYGAKARADESGLYEAGDSLRPARIGSGLGMVTALRRGAHEDLWVATNGRGAFHYDMASHLIERFTFEGTAGGLRSDYVFSVFVDREEVVWFGTDRGVCRYDPHAPRVENVSSVGESNFVRTLFESTDGRTLLAGTNRGLFLYDREGAAWRLLPELPQSPVYAIAADKSGRFFVGAGNGLYRSEKPARAGSAAASEFHLSRVEAGANDVRGLALFQGTIYAGTFGRGLERVDENGRTLVWPQPQAGAQEEQREIVSLHADTRGRLWIGTALAGVFVFDGREVKTVPALERLKGAAVWAIKDGGNDYLWLASARGLYLYHAGELKEIAQGLDARSVLSDASSSQAAAWCATAGGGLLRVLIDKQLGAVVSRLDAEQGLPSQNTFAVLPLRNSEGADETLLIATSRGVARYVPSTIAPVLNVVRVSGQRAHRLDELATGLKLDYPQNSLLLDVAATSSRTYPEQFQYAFQLYDAAGKVVKQKFSHDAQFAMDNLKAGKYRVIARAFSKDLAASAPLTFEMNVAGAPFPWTTALLSVLLALALVALWWGYRQNRRLARTGATLVDTNRQLADARMQLANETEAERRRIARDLHDQTLADLRHLLMMTDQLPTNGTEGAHSPGDEAQTAAVNLPAPVAFRSEIEAISTEIRRICEDLSPSVLENVGFLAALEWALSNAVAHAPPERKFEYEFEAEENLEERLGFQRATEMQIYRILQEAVSNILRHAGATRVRLSVSLSNENEFLLALEDNGRDFDPRERKKRPGRGLMNIRARASLIDAEVGWGKRPGGGTVFTLRKAGAGQSSSEAKTEN